MCCLAEGIAKTFLFIVNTVFFMLGIALVGVGVFVLMDDSVILDAFSYVPAEIPVTADDINSVLSATSFLKAGAIIIISVGAAILFIGFCGCCGACCKNKCLIGTYGVLVLLILIVQITGAALVWVFKSDAETLLVDYLQSTIDVAYDGPGFNADVIGVSTDTITLAWDTLQLQFGCCGVSNYTSYATASLWTNTYTYNSASFTADIPPSCCQVTGADAYPSIYEGITPLTSYSDCMTLAGGANLVGCYTTIYDLLNAYSLYVFIAGVSVAALEFISVCKTYTQ